MDMKTIVKKEDGRLDVQAFAENGRRASWGGARVNTIHLNGARVKAALVYGVGTAPEYRRAGLVRAFLGRVNDFAEENGCPVSLLHPFSFSFYRQFGYERVADHRVLEFPMSALDCVPRFADMIFAGDGARNADFARVYNEFAAGRNIMVERTAEEPWTARKGRKPYIWYDRPGHPAAFLVLEEEEHFNVNRMDGFCLNVHELGFTSPEALDRALGFLRMFEGQLERVKIMNCAMAPEVELALRHYAHTGITVIPDLMARVNDVGAVLSAVTYPALPGRFTVRVREAEDSGHRPDRTDGVWRVEYADGAARVERLPADAPADITCDIPAFTQLLFGWQSYGEAAARYMRGVVLHNPCPDFFRAFPNRPGGLFEHF